jgi:hypothetical protein
VFTSKARFAKDFLFAYRLAKRQPADLLAWAGVDQRVRDGKKGGTMTFHI